MMITLGTPITDWDDAYYNAKHIDDRDQYVSRWEEKAIRFRQNLPQGCSAQTDIAYGEKTRQKLDLFLPASKPKGLAVFIHGGYWLAFDKNYWSHLARGPLMRGWAVAMPSYTLAPDAHIRDIGNEIAVAIAQAAREVKGPIRLTGHSAGGHLATRMVCGNQLLDDQVLGRVEHVMSISGVHDLRPLMHTDMNKTLRLESDEAASESPALLVPNLPASLTAVVGADEREEFLRQTDLIANVWHGLGASTRAVRLPDLNHYNVIEGLAEPDSEITNLFLESE